VTPVLAEYDPASAARFRAEAEAIAGALGDAVVEIEHVGSTAVPGLAGKPTVDLAVGVTTLELDETAVRRMVAAGYEDARGDSRPGEVRFRKGDRVPREVIVHVVEWGGPAWDDALRFRDALRADRTLAREYEELKRRLLEEQGNWYSGRDKKEFVDRVLEAAGSRAYFRTDGPDETESVAAQLAHILRRGDVATVSGELGTGKTTFVRGAAAALGVRDHVTSPTYTIGHRYRGAVDVSHIDLYRFQGISSAEWGDLEPYFEDAVVFVEWPEAAEDVLPAPRVEVRLRHVDSSHRLVVLSSTEGRLLDRIVVDADARV
jgi:tRNA threonylcarbamoyladenosine biosynthesis protein TsaE